MRNAAEINQKIRSVLETIRSHAQKELPEPIQKELGILVNLMPEVGRLGDIKLAESLEIAVLSLLSETPNVDLAVSISKKLALRTRKADKPIGRIRKIVQSSSPLVKLMLGIVILTVLTIPALAYLIITVNPIGKIMGLNTHLIFQVIMAGLLGGVVSVLGRILKYRPTQNTGTTTLTLIAMSKPMIGAVFGTFIFAVVRSGLIPMEVAEANETYFYFALAFIAGFSERFVKDIISKTEKKVGAAAG